MRKSEKRGKNILGSECHIFKITYSESWHQIQQLGLKDLLLFLFRKNRLQAPCGSEGLRLRWHCTAEIKNFAFQVLHGKVPLILLQLHFSSDDLNLSDLWNAKARGARLVNNSTILSFLSNFSRTTYSCHSHKSESSETVNADGA